MRAASELGLRTVAIYSEEDRLGLHRFKADEAYLIGKGNGPIQAYLDIDGIVALAQEKQVDAIHPGYGFLSENPAFSRACQKGGIAFIGPEPELLELLGDKVAARHLAEKAGVRVVPGTEKAVQSLEAAKKAAKSIGFPLIAKASFGGGGRGMRIIRTAGELEARLEEASREAAGAFGDGAVFLEKYIERARHIEVQILADRHITILRGEEGAARLDGSGEANGPIARLRRLVSFTVMDQLPDFASYEQAVRDGGAVVMVRVRGDRLKRAVLEALRARGGHFINYYGRFATEELERWHGPEPDIPSLMRR